MTNTVPHAITRLESFFADRDTRPGVIGRRLLGVSKPQDERLAALLCHERDSSTKMDGSIGGAFVSTVWTAWEMMDLGLDAVQGGLSKVVAWVVTFLEGKPTAPAPTPRATSATSSIPSSRPGTSPFRSLPRTAAGRTSGARSMRRS